MARQKQDSNHINNSDHAKINGGSGSLAGTTDRSGNLPGTRSSSGLKYYPEGGWGWIIVIAVFITQVISVGLHFSFGVIFYVFQVVNYADRRITAWSGSLSFGLCHLLSPLILCSTFKYGPRRIAIIASVLSFLTLLITCFTNNVILFVLTFGILFGTTSALAMVASFVILCQYFFKKRMRVVAIAQSGCGFGTALFTPMIFECARYSGWFLAMLVPSLLTLLLVPLACAFRPVEMYYPGRLKPTGPKPPSTFLDTLPPINPTAIKPFQLWLAVTFFSSVGFYIPISILIDVCVSSQSLSSSNSVIMLVVFGTMFAAGCALAASFAEFNADRQILQLRTVIQASLFLSTVSVSLLMVDQGLMFTLSFCTLFGLSTGLTKCLSVAFLQELMGLKLFSHSWALENSLRGVGYLLGLPVAMYIRDLVSGSYQYTSLLLATVAYFISFLLMLFMRKFMQDPSRAFLATLDYPPVSCILGASNGQINNSKPDYEASADQFNFGTVSLSAMSDKPSLPNQISLKESHDSLYQTITPPNQREDESSKSGTFLGLPDGSAVLKSIKQSIGSSISLVSPNSQTQDRMSASNENNRNERSVARPDHQLVDEDNLDGGSNGEHSMNDLDTRLMSESCSRSMSPNFGETETEVVHNDIHDYADLTQAKRSTLAVNTLDGSGSFQQMPQCQKSNQGRPGSATSAQFSTQGHPDQYMSSPGSITSINRKKRLPPDPSLYPEYYRGLESSVGNSESMPRRGHEVDRRSNPYAYNATAPISRRFEPAARRNVRPRVSAGTFQRRDEIARRFEARDVESPIKTYEPPWKNQLSLDANFFSGATASEDSSDQSHSRPESAAQKDSVLRQSEVYIAFTDNDRESIL